MAYPFSQIEPRWQQFWREHGVFRALEPGQTDKPPVYVLDMFPYPSGAGLHVGHPEGYTATDIVSRCLRLRGYNVLHPMGWDAFGLPAEQYAIKNNVHPAKVTAENIANFKRQLEMLGLGYDWSREIATTDPGYYRWTQWIFLQLYHSYFDPIDKRARPIAHLQNELFNGNLLVAPDDSIVENPTQEGLESVTGEVASVLRRWESLTPEEQRRIIDNQRLAYVAEVPVNWCPELGTTLANEEVIDGRSEVGGFPVERRPLRQWMLRITAYADRLIDDLEGLEWPESLKEMQRNWIGRSTGASIDFAVQGRDDVEIEVYTTRPDTLFGATYMVLAPEHPLVEQVTTPEQWPAVEKYREEARNRSERDRMAEAKHKTGVFTGAYAINPANEEPIPIWTADYVLMGYGTGAIMAVPAHDERDFEFAKQFGLPIRQVVAPRGSGSPAADPGFGSSEQRLAAAATAFPGEGVAINSDFLNDLPTAEAKERMIHYLAAEGLGRAQTNYKLRDWLFSRQRYWGEPFPILWDEDGNHYAVDEQFLPVELPPMEDFRPTGSPEGPLAKATDWLTVTVEGKTYRRETNTMPQWAGSCWYYLRYIDPQSAERLVDPEKERYWMPVELYVGGVEHAVLHLLYARFWHKVLFDLGHVSTPEPFMKLVNQGMILGETEYHFFERPDGGGLVSAEEVRDLAEEATGEGVKLYGFEKRTGQKVYGTPVIEALVEKRGQAHVLRANPQIRVDARSFKMSKSRGNVVNPDRIVADYGADVFRLYEMYMGPLEAAKPWNTRDIIGMSRFLNRVWRTFVGDAETGAAPTLGAGDIPPELERRMHRAIRKVGEDIEGLRFNTAIAELIELLNEAARLPAVPRALARVYTLLLSPFAPHIAEEIWQGALGMETSVVLAEWPAYDPAKLVETSIEVPVQVNGKLRGKVTVPADADEQTVLAAAEADVARHLEGRTVRKRVYVPGKMVNLVVG